MFLKNLRIQLNRCQKNPFAFHKPRLNRTFAAKRSFLELADGSKIWVNANTRVVYPVTFENKKREIYVDGEIYIEVFPDKERPFT
ncbi:MAG: FecR domain-containing protein [Parabacteroides sp.]